MRKKFEFLKALAVFTSTIIGVGIFGLPYVAMKVGFFVVLLYFFAIAILAIVVHCLLGEVSRDTHTIARIPGYAGEYIGPKAKKISFVISSLGLIGALLAYLILGGEFLYLLLGKVLGGPSILYALVFFIAGAYLIYHGMKNISYFEFIMFIAFMGILVFFFYRALPFIHFNHFLTFSPKLLTFPYGVVLFSLWGIAMVPEIKEMVNRDRKRLRQVIITGVVIAALCYLFFILTILGASGPQTSKNAITGFAAAIGDRVVNLGYIFGLITTFTSFITLGLTLKKIFWYDFKVSHRVSWTLACFIPLGLYFLGLKNFIDVIGLTGALMLGLEAIIVVFIYKNFMRKRFQCYPGHWIYLLILIFLIGIGLEFVYFFTQ